MAHEQVGFSTRNTGGGKQFSYQLRNEYTGEISPLSFTLRQSDLADTSGGLKPMADIRKDTYAKIKIRGNQRCKELAVKFNGAASCEVTTATDSYRVATHYTGAATRKSVQAEVANIQAELNQMEVQGRQASGYVWEKGAGIPTYGVDYASIAKKSVAALAPVAKAVKDMDMPIADPTNRRVALLRAIAFMQAIPYDNDPQLATSLHYRAPLQVLVENRGNCDSKSVAYAAIVHTIAPGMPVAIIAIPNHALVGLGIPAQEGDATITQGGMTYVLAEPVGPAPAPIGQISPFSQDALEQNSGVKVIRVF